MVKERGIDFLLIRRNKKGSTESPAYSNIIFLILNILFFVILIVFIYRAEQGLLIYEQGYAKEIALSLDKAKPGSLILINLEKGIEIAKTNKAVESNIVKIIPEKGMVVVSLSGKEGYGFTYFSDYSVKYEINGNYLKLEVGEKNGL